MKNLFLLSFLSVSFWFSSNLCSAQRSYEMELLNLVQINETEFRFDVRFRNTAADPVADFIAVEMMQFQVAFNTDMLNGGAFNNTYLQYVANTTDLVTPAVSPITPVSGNVTSDQTEIQWVTQALGADGYTVMINNNNWLRVGTFKAILKAGSTSGNSKNLASVLPNLTLVPSGCLCNWCNVDFDVFGDGGYTRASGAVPNLIETKTLTNSTINKPLYSNAFTSTGNYNDAVRWNNSVHSTDPSYHVVPSVFSSNISIGSLSATILPEPVQGICTLTDNHTVNDLSIGSTSTLTLNPATQLTVNGTFYKENSSNAALTLKSTAAGTGSLIQSTSGISATVERFISGYINYASELQATHGWHLLSSPLNTFLIAGSSFEPGGSDDLYSWNEPADTWYNYKSSNPSQIEPGKGYLVAYSADATKTFTGVLNSSDVLVSGLTNSTKSIHSGFNLLGNPFSSALVWNKTGGNWSLSGVDANCQVWDEVNASYKVIPPDGIIPAMNGFMVYTTGGGALTIPKTSQENNTQAWYKNGQQDNNRIVLVARDPEGQTAQESVIRFNAAATEGYDNEYDSYFLCGFAPQFYSVAGNESYALNTLPTITNNLAIPFTFVKNGSGTFSIELAKTLPDAVLYLQDNKTNTIQNLSENPVYNFSAEEGDQPDRFVLRFGTEFLGVNPADTKASFTIWYNQGNINFSSKPGNVLSMSIIDMAGREIVNLGRPATDKVSVGKNLAPGYYIVKIKTTDAMVARKLYIN